MRRRGLLVAVVGPDGAGKSTLVSRLPDAIGHPSLVVYMGVNPESTTHALPTMRWAQRRGMAGGLLPAAVAGVPQRFARRRGGILPELRAAVTYTHRLADLGYRFAAGWRAARAGGAVVFDRYVYDARIDTLLARQPLSGRVYARLVMALFPDPDLLLILDAPSELLYARKGEHSVVWLDGLRAAYRRLADEVPNSVLIDATQPADQVLHSTAAMIRTRLVGDAQ